MVYFISNSVLEIEVLKCIEQEDSHTICNSFGYEPESWLMNQSPGWNSSLILVESKEGPTMKACLKGRAEIEGILSMSGYKGGWGGGIPHYFKSELLSTLEARCVT